MGASEVQGKAEDIATWEERFQAWQRSYHNYERRLAEAKTRGVRASRINSVPTGNIFCPFKMHRLIWSVSGKHSSPNGSGKEGNMVSGRENLFQ